MRDNNEIIEIIKKLMDKNNLSISELARRTGMAKSTISRYLNQTREFPLNKADDIARVLHITPEYLLGFENEKEPKPTTTAAHLDGEDLTEEEWKDVQEYIDFIRQKRNK